MIHDRQKLYTMCSVLILFDTVVVGSGIRFQGSGVRETANYSTMGTSIRRGRFFLPKGTGPFGRLDLSPFLERNVPFADEF